MAITALIIVTLFTQSQYKVGGLHGAYLIVVVTAMVEQEHTEGLVTIQHHKILGNLVWVHHPIMRAVDL